VQNLQLLYRGLKLARPLRASPDPPIKYEQRMNPPPLARIGAPIGSDPRHWPNDMLVTRDEAAAFLTAHGLATRSSTLACWASRRPDGPPFRKFSYRQVWYCVGELRTFLDLALATAAARPVSD
jgi:hypothetical protein